MIKLEQLRLDYLSAKKKKELYQENEKHAHKKILEYEEKMREIEKEIKEIEKKENKVNESVLIIKDYCTKAKCDDCQFNAPYNVCNLARPPIDW